MLGQLCSKLALDTVESMKAQAWGLEDPTQAPPKSGRRLRPRRPTRADAKAAVAEQEHKEVIRTPQEAIKVRWATDGEEATPIGDLTAEAKESRWCDMAAASSTTNFASSAMTRGCAWGDAWTLKALADPWEARSGVAGISKRH